tara:strand:- start:2503 stop:3057 length:555 start_codon:yes stop_codon:yes gene_type:complete
MCKLLKFSFHALCFSIVCISATAFADQRTSGGKHLSDTEINAQSITIYPNGHGLPAGNGTAIEGKSVYMAKCLACHGSSGTNGVAPRLVGKEGYPKGSTDVLRSLSVGAWPNATTIFDYVKRAMPHNAPKSLSDVEVYQLTAYILYLNNLITKDQDINKESLPSIEMPNKKQVINIWNLEQENQ